MGRDGASPTMAVILPAALPTSIAPPPRLHVRRPPHLCKHPTIPALSQLILLILLILPTRTTPRVTRERSYACVSFIGVFFIKLFVPETKGKSLAQIQAELRGEAGSGYDKIN